jgi:hypothetical protein
MPSSKPSQVSIVDHRFSVGFLALFVLIYSTVLRAAGLHADSPLHSDTPAFLQVVALLRGEWAGPLAPFRVEYPVYSYGAYLLNHLVPDWLLAAKWAAFLPSVLVPMAVFWAALILSCDRYAAFFAGFLAASSSTLIQTGALPLYDATFIFAFALFMVAGLLFIRRPAWGSAALLGLLLGVCWASRGLGLFLLPVVLCGILVLPQVPVRRKCALLLVVLTVLLATAFLIRLPAKLEARAFQEDKSNCFKEVMVDGALYAGGRRDQIVYQLNQDATAFQLENLVICDLSWKEFAHRYFKEQMVAFAANFKKIILYDLVDILAPFVVLFLPLAFGMERLLTREHLPEALFLGATTVSFLLLVPAIQYQDRYLVPLIVPAAMVAGIGCSRLLAEGKRGRWVLTLFMIVAFVAGTDCARHLFAHDAAEANYRMACEWILARDGKDFSFNVMERHHGVYVYLKHGLISLPVDDPERVRKYAGHVNVKYIVAGPDERRHNPQLFADTAVVKLVKEFGSGPEAVELFELNSVADGAHQPSRGL